MPNQPCVLSMQILIEPTFRRDYARWKKAGWNMRLLATFISDASSGWPLPSKYEAHPLKGRLQGLWDAHIRQNWVVFFRVEKDCIKLLRMGTHAYLGIGS